MQPPLPAPFPLHDASHGSYTWAQNKTGDLQISYHTVEASVFLSVLVSHWGEKKMFFVGDVS